MLRKLLGIAPKEEAPNVYSPSPAALKMATQDKTNYDHTQYPNAIAAGSQKVIMVCTEQAHMTMANGKVFLTGNHPVEMFVPMLHLEAAGYTIEVATPTGQSVALEMWAFPEEDEAVKGIYEKYQTQLQQPKSLAKVVNELGNGHYAGVFIPGGHGAMLGLPESKELDTILRWAHQNDRPVMAICHGPAALLATQTQGEPFLYKGYAIAAFPDSADKSSPTLGYLPGPMPWYFGEKLEAQGMEIVNKAPKGTCHQDRLLVTGDSPFAANDFGKMSAEALLANALVNHSTAKKKVTA